MATRSDLIARARVRRKMERNRDQGRAIDQAQIDHRKQRAALYAEGRELDPPMTYAEIAEIFGITEGAVMQLTRKFYADKPS